MAVLGTNRPFALGTGFGVRLMAAVRILTHKFLMWNESRATRVALNKLSDHELEDIGLTRGDIDAI
jgi:uncharacterized protein YjiS (DUF1127 family)